MMLILATLACAPVEVGPGGTADTGDTGHAGGVVDDTAAAPLGVTPDFALGHVWACMADENGVVDCETIEAPDGTWYTLDGDWGTLCAIGGGNEGRCWGDVETIPGRVEQIAAGDGFACWLRLDVDGGQLECEGGIASPPSGSDWMDLSAGGDTACALSDDGVVTCWGGREFTDGSGWDRVTVGSTGDLCAARWPYSDGLADVRCWGLQGPDTPVAASRLAVGAGWALVQDADGRLLSLGKPPWDAADLDGLGPVLSVEASSYYACGMLADGEPRCWGR